MEKKLSLIKKNEQYVIKDDDFEIVILDLKVDSQEIYEKIYSNLPCDDNFVKIKLETTLVSKEDNIIYKQLSSLFNQIDKSINVQLLNCSKK